MSEDTEAPAEAKPAAKGKAQGKKGPAKASDAGRKGKGKDKGKGKGKAAGASDGAALMSVAGHPRARAQIRQAKGWGGLSAFGVTAYLSLSHGVSPDLAGMRAIAAGAAGYIVAWGCGVMVWRQLMVAELRARVERARQAIEEPAQAASEQPARS